MRIVIVGTGDLAYGLASFYRNNNGFDSGNTLQVTKPNLNPKMEGTPLHNTDVPIANFDESIKAADVIILAIPAAALQIFVPEHYSRIKNKILVDPTNSRKNGEDLRALLDVTDVRWVKAFNDVAALEGMVSKASDKTKVPAKMCSPSHESLEVVKSFAEKSLGFDVKVVPYERYADIANSQNSLGTEWVIASVYQFVFFVIFQIYNIFRHHVNKGYEWYNFPLFVTNKALAWVVLHGFASAMIPGRLSRNARKSSLNHADICLFLLLYARYLGSLS